jgi:alkylation response protein AidB-like acyl-CoA dehydrogenase
MINKIDNAESAGRLSATRDPRGHEPAMRVNEHQRLRHDPQPVRYGSPELAALIDSIGSGAFERERDGIGPFDAIELVRRSRLGALRLPRELGGGASSLRELFAVVTDLAAVDSNVAHILRAHFYFVENRLSSPDPAERARWLVEVARGAIFGNATTELGSGGSADFGAPALRTRLTPAGGDYVLNGTKYYCTGSLYSDWVAVIAADGDNKVAMAVVPADRDGVRLEDDWDGIGQRLTGSGTVHFDDVRVGADELIDESRRAERPTYTGAFLQLYLTAVIAGIVAAASADAVAVLQRRARAFPHAASLTPVDDPLLQQVVGQLATNAYTARAVVLAAADAMDVAALSVAAGHGDADLLHEVSLRAAQAKIAVDELAQRSGWLVFEVGGASATRQAHNLDRHWRNARTVASHNPAVHKTRAIGDHLVNGSPLPSRFF